MDYEGFDRGNHGNRIESVQMYQYLQLAKQIMNKRKRGKEYKE